MADTVISPAYYQMMIDAAKTAAGEGAKAPKIYLAKAKEKYKGTIVSINDAYALQRLGASSSFIAHHRIDLPTPVAVNDDVRIEYVDGTPTIFAADAPSTANPKATPTNAPTAPSAKTKPAAGKPKFGKDIPRDWKPRDLYQEVTNKIIEALEAGTAPWQRPWTVKESGGLPVNGLTGSRYHGTNPFLLMLSSMEQNFTSNRWATYRQAAEKGITLKKGSIGTTVYFAKPMQVEDKEPATGLVRKNPDGTTKMKTIPMLKAHTVFNAEQFDNFPNALVDIDRATNPEWIPVEAAELIVQGMGVKVSHGGSKAFYRPSTDEVQMPEKSAFKTPEDYYATVLHELGHSTGHKDRLARDMSGGFGSESYAYEELVAEMSSLYVTSDIGLSSGANVERHSSYLASWLKALKDDKKLIFKAAKQAEKVHAWIMNEDRTPANSPAPAPAVDAYREELKAAVTKLFEQSPAPQIVRGAMVPGIALTWDAAGKPVVTHEPVNGENMTWQTLQNAIIVGEDAANPDALTDRILKEAYKGQYNASNKTVGVTDPRGVVHQFATVEDFQGYAEESGMPLTLVARIGEQHYKATGDAPTPVVDDAMVEAQRLDAVFNEALMEVPHLYRGDFMKYVLAADTPRDIHGDKAILLQTYIDSKNPAFRESNPKFNDWAVRRVIDATTADAPQDAPERKDIPLTDEVKAILRADGFDVAKAADGRWYNANEQDRTEQEGEFASEKAAWEDLLESRRHVVEEALARPMVEFDEDRGVAKMVNRSNGETIWEGDSIEDFVQHQTTSTGMSNWNALDGSSDDEICKLLYILLRPRLGSEVSALPDTIQQAIMRAHAPTGELDMADKIKNINVLVKQGLASENGYLTDLGLATKKGQEALRITLESGAPITEHVPQPAPKKTQGAQKALWGSNILQGKIGNQHAWSNGHVAFVWNDKTTPHMPTHVKPSETLPNGAKVDMERLWPAETGKVITPLAVSGHLGNIHVRNEKTGGLKSEFGHGKTIWFDSEQTMDAKYYDMALPAYPNAVFRQAFDGDHQKPIEVFDGLSGPRVGIIMGTRGGQAGFPPVVSDILIAHQKNDDKPVLKPWHVEHAKEGMVLVSPEGEKKPIRDIEELQRTISTIVAYDNDVSEIRDELESQYWEELPIEQYKVEAEKLMKERYGISLGDAEPEGYANAAKVGGLSPAFMVEQLSVKHNLTPITAVVHPYGLKTSSPNTPTAGQGAAVNRPTTTRPDAAALPKPGFSSETPK